MKVGTKKKNFSELEVIYKNLSDESKDAYDLFISNYANKKPYKSAVLSMIVDAIQKYNFRDINVEDYKKVLKYYKTDINSRNSQDRYRDSFFKFIYNFDVVEDSTGFSDYFTKDSYTKQIDKNSSVNSRIDPRNNTLSLLNTIKLEEYLSETFFDEENLKSAFVAYCIYNLGVDISKLKSLKLDAYDSKNKTFSLNNEVYPVSEKYISLFEEILPKKKQNNGFSFVDSSIKTLGSKLNFNNFTPQVIKNTRTYNNMRCTNCYREYPNIADYWVSVQNKIMCIECYKELKKNINNENFIAKPIRENHIKITKIIDDEHSSNLVYSFNKLQSRFINKYVRKGIDFNELNKFKKFIGDLGEVFVYEYEKSMLENTQWHDLVDNTPSKNPLLGYDILSYDFDGNKKYIEVKTEPGNNNNDFFISDNEMKIGKELMAIGEKYYIYRIHNILGRPTESNVEIICLNELLTNKIYAITPNSWKISKRS